MSGDRRDGATVRSLADRAVTAVLDATVGTVIVLVHVALANRVRLHDAQRASPR